MKFLDKLGLVVFSIIILLFSILVCLIAFNWANTTIIIDIIKLISEDNKIRNIALGVSIVLIIWTLKCIFFNSEAKENLKSKEGILLENENGKLLVSKDTIESLANTVVKTFGSAETVMTKVEVDEESKIKIYITLFVNPDAIIKDLSNKLQKNIKEAVKKSLDLEVTEVNIRIKNIAVKKEAIVKE